METIKVIPASEAKLNLKSTPDFLRISRINKELQKINTQIIIHSTTGASGVAYHFSGIFSFTKLTLREMSIIVQKLREANYIIQEFLSTGWIYISW